MEASALAAFGFLSGPSSSARGLRRERCQCAGEPRGTKGRVEGEQVVYRAEQGRLEAAWRGGKILCTRD